MKTDDFMQSTSITRHHEHSKTNALKYTAYVENTQSKDFNTELPEAVLPVSPESFSEEMRERLVV